MAAEALDIRMARLEGAFAQINERLGALEQRLSSEIGAVRRELSELKSEFKSALSAGLGSVGGEISSVRRESGALRAEIADLRRQMNTQFYWLLTLILGSILIPLIRDFAQ